MAAIGRPGYINLGHEDDLAGRTDSARLESHAFDMLDAARESGITYADAARSYGKAEEFVAAWLSSRHPPPGELVVGSKWGYVYTADWKVDADVHETKIHTRANLDRQHVLSVNLVGDYLRLYQIHSATLESGVLENTDVIAGLSELRSGGLVIGLSTSGPKQADTIRRALEIEIDGALLFGTVQATWNLLEPSAGDALAEASDAGLGVIVKEAVANGRLTPRNHVVAERLKAVAAGWSPDAIAMASCLRQPWASVVLSGAASVDQLASNLTALDVPREVLEQLPSLAEVPEAYWRSRSALPWQ
jgi:aryl-alcohol dehydrogenase-like predicted oxidoreductase